MTPEERTTWLKNLKAGDPVILRVEMPGGVDWFSEVVEITNSEYVGVHCYLIQRRYGTINIPSFKTVIAIHSPRDPMAEEGLARFKLKMMLKRWHDDNFADHVTMDVVRGVLSAGGQALMTVDT